MTSNLDNKDDDESVLVTEYFGQRTAPLAQDGANADTSLNGVVYKLNLWDRSVQVIKLAPVADIGFKDPLNGTAGCFPNQLQSVTIAGGSIERGEGVHRFRKTGHAGRAEIVDRLEPEGGTELIKNFAAPIPAIVTPATTENPMSSAIP